MDVLPLTSDGRQGASSPASTSRAVAVAVRLSRWRVEQSRRGSLEVGVVSLASDRRQGKPMPQSSCRDRFGRVEGLVL